MLCRQRTSVITEHSAEVSYNIDNKEDSTFFRSHGEIRTACIPLNRMGSCRFHKEIKHCFGRTESVTRSIGCECEDENDDEQHDGVDVICEESGLDASEHGVDDYTDWEQEACCNGILKNI